MSGRNFPKLFSEFSLGALRLRNRIVFTAHHTHLATNVPTQELAAYHEARAHGGAGLVILEASSIHPTGWFAGHQIETFEKKCIPGYRVVAEACHQHNTAVFGQLFHPGREVRGRHDGRAVVTYAPSAVPGERHHVVPREMSIELIKEIIKGFADSAQNLKESGIDGAEILASHGYLPAQFLSPTINQRTDSYGGSIQARLRFLREIISAIRSQVDNFVIGVRVSTESHANDGVPTDVMLRACHQLESDGEIDYLSLVVGSASTQGAATHVVPPMHYGLGYVIPSTKLFREELKLPLMITGRINQPQLAEKIIQDDLADLCGMCRALICDPTLPNKAISGKLDHIRTCIACNQACAGHGQMGASVSCIQFPESGRELRYGKIPPADRNKNIVIVGGGPAGLKCASVAAKRGHTVTLYEAHKNLGGQVLKAQKLPGREEFGTLVSNLAQECIDSGVTIHTNTFFSEEMISAKTADTIVAATGADCSPLPTVNFEDAHIFTLDDILSNTANIGQSVLIADWRCDWVGAGIAELLTLRGCGVRLCVAGVTAAENVMPYVRDTLNARLFDIGVEVIPYVRIFGADKDSVYLQNIINEQPKVITDVDSVVSIGAPKPRLELETFLKKSPKDYHLIGDCLAPRTAEEAVYEGLELGAVL